MDGRNAHRHGAGLTKEVAWSGAQHLIAWRVSVSPCLPYSIGVHGGFTLSIQ